MSPASVFISKRQLTPLPFSIKIHLYSDERLWQAGAGQSNKKLPLEKGKQGGTAAKPTVPAARYVLWGFFLDFHHGGKEKIFFFVVKK